jgi:hypothetical protein
MKVVCRLREYTGRYVKSRAGTPPHHVADYQKGAEEIVKN